jgi:hypothetical protein
MKEKGKNGTALVRIGKRKRGLSVKVKRGKNFSFPGWTAQFFNRDEKGPKARHTNIDGVLNTIRIWSSLKSVTLSARKLLRIGRKIEKKTGRKTR